MNYGLSSETASGSSHKIKLIYGEDTIIDDYSMRFFGGLHPTRSVYMKRNFIKAA